MHSSLELRVNVLLLPLNLLNHDFLVGCVLDNMSRGQGLVGVGALGSPRNIMPVVEGVDHQNIDVRRLQNQIDGERMEHVPGIQVEEGSHKVETVNSDEGEHNDTRHAVEEEAPEECISRVGGYLVAEIRVERSIHKIEGQDEDVELDNAEDVKRHGVCISRALGSITEGENKLNH